MNKIHTWDLKNKNVFLRIDGNVPLENGVIQNDFRLRKVLPTLELLTSKGAHITIATHLGRPKGEDQKYSTAPLKAWFKQHGFGPEHNVLVLENLRFNSGEKSQDKLFAQELVQNMDYYVNDAWGALHRNDTSIALLPQLFPAGKRSVGLLVDEELTALKALTENPAQPYLVFLGGGKPATKLPIIEHLLEQQQVTTIVLLPAIVFTFLKAQGKSVGKSLVDDNLVEQARVIIQKAEQNNVELLFPLDYTFLEDDWNGPLKTCEADQFPKNGIGIGVGAQSLELFKNRIVHAETIFYNGAMGLPDQPETLAPLHELLQAIAHSYAYSIIGGGNSVAEVERLGIANQIDFCSTGGGATLLHISGQKLPGLTALAA